MLANDREGNKRSNQSWPITGEEIQGANIKEMELRSWVWGGGWGVGWRGGGAAGGGRGDGQDRAKVRVV